MKPSPLKQLVYKLLFSGKDHSLSPLLPGRHCVLCDERCHSNIGLLCEPCLSDLPRIGQSCSICSTEISFDIDRKLNANKDSDIICGACRTKQPYFDRCTIPLKYSFPVNELIKSLKYKDKIIYSRILAHLFIEALETRRQDLPDCIIPVPLHAVRAAKRGFNQSDLIAREITKILPCQIDNHSCRRIKHTQQQAGMNKKQRTQNIRKAFFVDSDFRYKHIAILDDVVTTGSTVNELARVFKQAGVETVEVWACAKANIIDS